VTVNGVGLAVHEWPGRGPAVVAIHGLTANHTCWASVADALAPDVRLAAYDLRGRGESDKPATGYSLATHGEDLAGLLDHFGLKRAIVIGHSLGAHIALRFAVTQPRRVARLILVDGGLDVRPEILDSLAPAMAGSASSSRRFPRFSTGCGASRCLPAAGTTTSSATFATTRWKTGRAVGVDRV
jgi:pimeloyl-ACP methyl ester carboxylesterase